MKTKTPRRKVTQHGLFQKFRAFAAHHRADATILQDFYISCCDHFLDEVIAALEARIADGQSPGFVRAVELMLCACAKESRGRRDAGLHPSYGDGVADLSFHHSAAELDALEAVCRDLLARAPDFYTAGVLLANALMVRGRLSAAEMVYAGLRAARRDDTESVTSFDPVFHRGLAASASHALADELPQVQWLKKLEQPMPRAVFVSGDYEYFQTYGRSLIASLAFHRADVGLVLHVMDMTADEGARLVAELGASSGAVALSTEWTGLRGPAPSLAARAYYHAIRFVRFHQFLEGSPETAAWLLDMDQLFNASPLALFDHLQDTDVSAVLLAARFDARSKVAAGAVGIAATDTGRIFMARVAGYLVFYWRAGDLVWGIDQVALFAVMVTMLEEARTLRVAGVPRRIYDGSYDADRLLWGAKVPDAVPNEQAVRRRIVELATGAVLSPRQE